MKNKKSGFIVPVLIAVIAVLLIVGGFYVYLNKGSATATNPIDITFATTSVSSPVNISVTPTPPQTVAPVITPTSPPTVTPVNSSSGSVNSNVSSGAISVPGMSKYVDSIFGFSFWYPTGWNVEERDGVTTNPEPTYSGGSILKTITVTSPEDPTNGIAVDEFVSSSQSITDHSDCGPAEGCPSSIDYYFNSSTHTWMKDSFFQYGQYVSPTKTTAADTSVNSMGGLHLFYGNARFADDIIVPLSAKNFLIVRNISAGTNEIKLLADTILALNPAVATPVSQALQIQTIQSELAAYLIQQTSISVTSPSGGEQLAAGQKYTIAWSSSGLPLSDKAEIDLISDYSVATALNGDSQVLLGSGSYSWNIQASQSAGPYRIRVLDLNTVDSPTVYAESNPFSIVAH